LNDLKDADLTANGMHGQSTLDLWHNSTGSGTERTADRTNIAPPGPEFGDSGLAMYCR